MKQNKILYTILTWIVRPILWIFYPYRVYGKENLKNLNYGHILCPNHLSNIDPVLLAVVYPYKICFMAKSELYKNPIVGWVITHMYGFPVKRGTGDTSAIEFGEKIIEEGHVMAICPEGKRIKDKDGVPQKAKSGVAVIAKATNAGVLPVAICSKGKIKVGSHVTVSYGKLITPEEMGFDKEEFGPHDIKKAANLVMERITELWQAER